MSGNMENLGRRIAGAGDLQAVVRSMKALAASNIGQYERAVLALGHYYRTVELGLSACLRRVKPAHAPPRGSSKKPKGVGALIFGSDQGLVGRFNEVLLEFALQSLGKLPGGIRRLWVVGERMHALAADRGIGPAGLFPVPASPNGIAPLVGQVLVEIAAARDSGAVEEVYLFHNKPGAGASYAPASKRLLPLDPAWQLRLATLPWPTKSLPEVIEGDMPALDAFLQGYFFVLIFQACAESLSSENASCLASMQRAEKSIEEMLEDLSRSFHRIRQESIDEELFDVISGYEALSGESP